MVKRIIGIMLSCLIIIFCSVFTGAQTFSLSLVANIKKVPIYRVGREDKKVSITFDAAWGVDYTDDILAALERFNIKCTFFVVQFWAEKYPDYLKKIVAAGHEIGTHSKTHSHMTKLCYEAMTEELTSSSSLIESIVGKKVKLFRPPFGEYDNLLLKAAEVCGLYAIQWDVDSLDWKDLSAFKIAERVIKRTKSGSIILCHNNGLHTAEALPMIFSALLGKGYTFVPVSDLIYTEDFFIDNSGEQKSN